jgi:hypothetical protein
MFIFLSLLSTFLFCPIFTFSIFSKLSFSMFVNIALIGFYEVYVCFYFKAVSDDRILQDLSHE